MKIQLVMPSINLWEKYTRPAIDSAIEAMMRAKSHGIDCRFLLIDNASSDQTKDEAGKRVSEIFSHKRNEERWGFQRSVNFGVNDAFERGFDVAFVLNNDIILHPDSIWRIAERFEKGDVGLVSAMDIRGELEEKNISPSEIGRLLSHEKENVDEAPHPSFSAFAVDKLCWEMIGEFDELFFPAYFEDNDYHYRMDVFGLPAIVYPPAMFYHFGSRTQNESSEDGRPVVSGGAFENNRAYYVKKWGGLPGSEKFKTPYDDPKLNVTSVKQNS